VFSVECSATVERWTWKRMHWTMTWLINCGIAVYSCVAFLYHSDTRTSAYHGDQIVFSHVVYTYGAYNVGH